MQVRDVNAVFPIDKVTVYPEAALLVRKAAIPLAAGPSKILVTGLPRDIKPETIRVDIGPGKKLTIIEVNSQRRLLEQKADEEYQNLKKNLASLETDRKKRL